MFVSLNWLRDYLVKADVKIDPKDLASKLTMRGLQVSGIKKPSFGLENVVVGRIEKIEKHPNADRLQVTRIILSEDPKEAPRVIVCGANNIAEGDIVPVALPGANLPGDLVIKVSTIRGVESFGMLCSGKELGLSEEEGGGILKLPKHAPLGQAVARLIGPSGGDDIILEFELTPNRSDCLSIIGMAREVAPLVKTKLREPKPARFRITPHRTSSIIKVEVDDPQYCPRYVARVIDSVKVQESPEWIKQRLQSVGIRPINNIVDVTNFVMIEYGQPLHAFDLRKIESGLIRVAPCKAPTDFTILSGETVRLEEGDILILDGERPIALAGIMGGANSQIEADTTSIVLESAVFPAAQIRRTAKRLGLMSEAAKRFEKGIDVTTAALASERAAALLRDSFNANVYHPAIDTNETPHKESTLSVDLRDVRKITGMPLSSDTVADVLETIGITSHKKSMNILSIRVPSYRLDLREGVDIVEEVARLVGYESIPEKFPVSPSAFDRVDESQYEFEQKIKHVLCNIGLSETIHYSFTSPEILQKYGMMRDDAVYVKNPISEEMKVMRTYLLPSLLQTYIYNKNRKTTDQRLFELARVYGLEEEEETKVLEATHVSSVMSGRIGLGQTWKGASEPVDFFYAKGLLENMVRQLTTVYLAFEPLKSHRLFHPSRSAIVKLGVREIGYLGEVHPFIRDQVLETNEPVVMFELNIDALRKYERSTVRYKPPSKFPAVELDLAFVVDSGATGHLISEAIRHAGGNLLNELSIFDVYQGDNIPAGKKSLAFRLSFISPERTLHDDEVNALKDKIISTVSEKFSAQLRS
jgi:phenylalanyl-tRNA synthetase beta chain